MDKIQKAGSVRKIKMIFSLSFSLFSKKESTSHKQYNHLNIRHEKEVINILTAK